jgi:hypothetical protein
MDQLKAKSRLANLFASNFFFIVKNVSFEPNFFFQCTLLQPQKNTISSKNVIEIPIKADNMNGNYKKKSCSVNFWVENLFSKIQLQLQI